jgi:hypothetical protein
LEPRNGNCGGSESVILCGSGSDTSVLHVRISEKITYSENYLTFSGKKSKNLTTPHKKIILYRFTSLLWNLKSLGCSKQNNFKKSKMPRKKILTNFFVSEVFIKNVIFSMLLMII